MITPSRSFCRLGAVPLGQNCGDEIRGDEVGVAVGWGSKETLAAETSRPVLPRTSHPVEGITATAKSFAPRLDNIVSILF